MKTFGYKRKMYLIIFFGLIYNLYLYQQDDEPNCEQNKTMVNPIVISENLNLRDSSTFEIFKSLK